MLKWKSKSGESLVECLAALMVIVFVIAMLPAAAATAARINRQAGGPDAKTLCAESRDPDLCTRSEITIQKSGGPVPETETLAVDLYSEDGFYYYSSRHE